MTKPKPSTTVRNWTWCVCVCACVLQVDSYPSAGSQILLVAQFERFFLLFLPIVPSEQTKALSAAQKPAKSVQRHSNEVKCAAVFCPGRWLQHRRCCFGRRKRVQQLRGSEGDSHSMDPARGQRGQRGRSFLSRIRRVR